MSGWRPIETAPRDGTPILVCMREKMLGSRMHVATFHGEREVIAGYWRFDCPELTHWMPLPEPPDD